MTCLSYLWHLAVEDRKHDDLSVLSVGSSCRGQEARLPVCPICGIMLLRTGSMMTCLFYLWDQAVEDRKHDDLTVLSVGSRC